MINANQSMYQYLLNSTKDLADNSKVISFYGRKMRKTEFHEEVIKIASFLQNKGIKKGENVVICLGNIPSAIISFYAVNAIGAIANLVHPLITNQQLEEVIKETKPSALILFDEFFTKYECLKDRQELIVVASASDYLPRLYVPFYNLYTHSKKKGTQYINNVYKYSKIQASEYKEVELTGYETAIYMHSGGTTGKPKIACISSYAMNNMEYNMFSTVFSQEHLDDSWGMLMALPIFHTFGLGVCMHSMLVIGSQIILMPKFKANHALLLMLTNPVKMIAGIPSMFKKMSESPFFRGNKLKKLQECFCGGEKLSSDVKQSFETKLEKYGNNMKIAEGYGLTETGVVLLNTQNNSKPGSIGAPLNNVKVKILDENKTEVKCGDIGNIYIHSNSLMNNYLDQDIDDVFVTINEDKYINTGDMGYVDNTNHVYFVEREKRMIKISGNNVFPSEIESVVNNIPEIDCSCAVGAKLNGKTVIKLFVVLKNDSQRFEDVQKIIKSDISKKLLKYAQPTLFEVIEKMPRTQIGKIDYKELEK